MGRKIYNPETGEWREWTGDRWAPVEGATPTQIEAARMAARTTAEQPGGAVAAGLIQFGENFGTPFLSRILGGGAESEAEAQARRGALREEFPRATVAGDVAAIGAQMAMPAGSVLRGGRLAAAPVAANVGAQAAMGALSSPEDPMLGAVLAGGAGVAGAGVARVLAGAMGMPERVAAQRMRAAAGPSQVDGDIMAAAGRVAPARTFDEMATTAGQADDAIAAARKVFEETPLTMGGATGALTQSPAHAGMVERARRLGFELLPGEEFNSRPLRMVEDFMANHPTASAATVQPLIDRNARRGNALIARYMDEVAPGAGLRGADEITPESLGRYRTELQKGFSDVYEAAGPVPAEGLKTRFAEIAASPEAFGVDVEKIAQNALRFAKDGEIRPAAVQSVRNTWAKKAADLYRQGDHVTGDVYDMMVRALDGQVAKAQGGEALDRLDRLRQGWRFLIALEKPGVVRENGMVSMPALYRNIRNSYRLSWEGVERPGKQSEAMGDVVDALRVSNFFTDTWGKSPTAMRLFSKELFTPSGAAQALGGPLLSRAYLGGARSDTGRRLIDRFAARQAAGIMDNPAADLVP